MVLLLTGSVLTMVAHHLLYEHLNQQPVGNDNLNSGLGFGINISQQGIYSAVGNTLAIVAKAFLASAIATAFTQLF